MTTAYRILSSEQLPDTPLLNAMVSKTDPDSFREATSSIDKEKWIEDMASEMASLVEKQVFELCPLPKGKRAIRCRWAYRTKRKVNGKVDRHKERLVAKGYLQSKGLYYHESYAPSTRQETIRLVFSYMARESWESQQMDVMMAFLNRNLKEEVYLKQPKGFVDSENPDWVWRVKASLYVLKQAPQEWNSLLTKELVSYGLVESQSDPFLFTRKQNGKVVGVVEVHVDDIIITGPQAFPDEVGTKLTTRFKMSQIVPVDTYLSLKVKRGLNGEVFLSQQNYIQHIGHSHLSSDSQSASVPCNASFLDLAASDQSPTTTKPYAKLIGMLQWVADGTRPDIQFAVNRLSQFLQAPRKTHLIAAVHVLRYLNSTKTLCLCLGTNKSEQLHGYSDADWASISEDCRSTTGWIFKYAGRPISWKLRRQPMVALSTTEGEYMAMSDGAKEAFG